MYINRLKRRAAEAVPPLFIPEAFPLQSCSPSTPAPNLSFLYLKIPRLSSQVTLKRTLGIAVKEKIY